jgi:hypothetical protein
LKKYLLTREKTSPNSEKHNKLAEYFTTKFTKTYTEFHKVSSEKKIRMALAFDFSIAKEQVVLTPAKLTAKDNWVLTRDRPTRHRFFNSIGAGGS